MANSTIDGTKIILNDLWPGTPDPMLTVPIDGFTGADQHNVATAVRRVGTKIKVYDDTGKGYATFIYLQYIAGTKATTLALAAKQFVSMDISEQATAGTTSTYYKVTDDASEALLGGPLAVAISAMTTLYYGWFWCGGVQPTSHVAALTGNYTTNGTLTAGGRFSAVANASATATYSDKIIIKLTSLAHATGTLTDVPAAGISLIADA